MLYVNPSYPLLSTGLLVVSAYRQSLRKLAHRVLVSWVPGQGLEIVFLLKRVVAGCFPVSVFLSVFVEGVRVERVVAELAGAGAAREVARPERRDGRRGRRAGLRLATEGSGRRGCLVLAQGPQDEAVLAAGRSAEPGLGRRIGVQDLTIWKR